jgi:hypothetical protein
MEILVETSGESFETQIENHPLILKIKHFLALNEKLSQKDIFNTLLRFRRQYINKELDLEYYREIQTGLFSLLDNDITIKFATDDLKQKIDISRNYLEFLMPFFAVLL